MLIAVSMAQALAVVLMLRVASAAARASAPTWSTPGSPCRKRRSEAPSLITSAVEANPTIVLIRIPSMRDNSVRLRAAACAGQRHIAGTLE
jgi:hypothetical protein